MSPLSQKQTVFITGASSGIGRATAEFFAHAGWNVAASMRDIEKAGSLQDLPGVMVVACDVVDERSVRTAITRTQEMFGQIDVLVNNAGYGLVGPFEVISTERIRRQFEVNFFGLQSVIRMVLPQMRERQRGVIVNISSIGGRMTFPLYSNYHATKWAVDGFSESLHYELEPLGIRVKVIEPGPVATDFYGRSMDLELEGDSKGYDAFMRRVLPKMSGGVKGAPVEDIARVIYRAATDGTSRLRYPAGTVGVLILWARRLLPDRLFFFMMKYVLSK